MILRRDPDDVSRTERLRGPPTWAIVTSSAVLWAGDIVYARLGYRFSLDLRVYRAAATSWIDGHNPYHLYFTGHHLPFTYPPFALLVFSPLTLGSVHLIEALWWLINAAVMTLILFIAVSTCFTLPRSRSVALALFLSPALSLAFEPVRSNTDYGQINTVLLLMVLIDLTRRVARGRGVLVGLAAAIKLTPLVYLIAFAVTRDWRALRRGLLTFAGVSVVAFVVLPGESRVFWFHQVLDPGRTGGDGSFRNQSWNGVVHRWPFPHDGVPLLWFSLAVLTVGAGAVLTQRLLARGRVIDAVVALGLTSELASPISWTHHWIWIVLIPVLLVRGFKGQPVVMATMILLCLVGAFGPYASVSGGWTHRVLIDSLTLAGGLVFVTWLISELRLQPWRRIDGLTRRRAAVPGA